MFLISCNLFQTMYIFINSKFYSEKDANISIFDHGFLYGDGIFETLRTYNGKVFKIDEHLDRIFHSARLIKLEIPLTKNQLKSAITSTIKKNKLKEAYIRLAISRGKGELRYSIKSNPNVVIIAKPFIKYPENVHEKGVSVITYNAERILPKVKSTSCLPLVLAKSEAAKKGCFDALLVDRSGFVTEGTVSNVFFIKENTVYTPKDNILKGITRGIVVKIAKKIAKIKETKIKKEEIYHFDECFLTNTSAEIAPVNKIDGKIIKNAPGVITKKLMEEFKKEVKNYYAKSN